MFFKNTGFLRHPQRSECAARLGIGDRKVAFFRLSAELRGAGKWKSEEGKNNRKPNRVPLPARTSTAPREADSAFAELDDVLTDIAADVLEGWTRDSAASLPA